jgi:hypothetical protein
MSIKLKPAKKLLSKLAGISICLTMLALAVLPPAPAEAARARAIVQDNNLVASNGEHLRGGPLTLSKKSFVEDPANGTNWTLDPANWVRMKRAGLNVGRVVLFDFQNRREGEMYWTVNEILPYLDIAVDNAEAAGMYIVINYHDVGGFTPAVLNEFWTAAAGRYASRTHVIYELANEPASWDSTAYTDAVLNNLGAAYKIIRDNAPNTPVIHLTFAVAKSAMVAKVNRYIQLLSTTHGVTLDFTDGKNAVGFHTYGTTSSTHIQNLKAAFPVICTEWGYPNDGQNGVKVLDGKSFHGQVLEGLDISWLDWRAGRKEVDFVDRYMRKYLADARQKNYIWTSEDFTGGFSGNYDSETVDADPLGWTVVGGTVFNDRPAIRPFPTTTNKSIRLGDTSVTEARSINRSFTAQAYNVALEFSFYQNTKVKNFTAQLRDGTTVGPQIITDGGFLKYVDGSGSHNIMAYNDTTWYTVVLAANSLTDKYDIFVNGVLKSPDVSYLNSTAELDNVFFSTGVVEAAATFVDNINVSNP